MKTSLTSKWIVDAVLTAGLIAAMLFDLTGLALHQWIGVGLAGLAAYHTLTHWDWIAALTRRFFRKTSPQARLYYLIDGLILGGLVTITLTGLVISSWLDLELANAGAWLRLHEQASYLTLAITSAKLILHRRWIVAVGKKVFLPAAGPQPAVVPVKPATAAAGVNRREFLKLISVAAVSSITMVGVTAKALQALDDVQAGTGTSSTTTTGTTGIPTSDPSIASLTCTEPCRHRCSFPGECRRYVDTNGNGRCDNGECA